MDIILVKIANRTFKNIVTLSKQNLPATFSTNLKVWCRASISWVFPLLASINFWKETSIAEEYKYEKYYFHQNWKNYSANWARFVTAILADFESLAKIGTFTAVHNETSIALQRI